MAWRPRLCAKSNAASLSFIVGAPIIDLPRMGPVIKGAVLHVSYGIICAELMAPTVRLRSPPEWGSLGTRIFGEGRYPVRSQPTQAAIKL
jgi:hypothetical protein